MLECSKCIECDINCGCNSSIMIKLGCIEIVSKYDIHNAITVANDILSYDVSLIGLLLKQPLSHYYFRRINNY